MSTSTTVLPAVSPEVLSELDATAAAASPEFRELLLAVRQMLQPGEDETTELTPSQAAARLGMSRTHLYKLLDRGEIPFHRVGRDRRIRMSDLCAFEEQRQRDSRELAERFARQNETRNGTIDEIAELL